MNDTNQTESSYVRALQAHRSADFSMLYDAYSPALYGFLLRLVNDPIRAQDLLQDTFVTIWSNSRQYDARQGRLFSWMLSIARNVAIETLNTGQSRTAAFMADRSALAGMEQKPAPDAVKTRLRMGLQRLKTYFSLYTGQYLAEPQV